MIKEKIKELLFGVKAKGEPLPPPTFRTTESTSKPSLNQWVRYVRFGSRYGHKGSFYNK